MADSAGNASDATADATADDLVPPLDDGATEDLSAAPSDANAEADGATDDLTSAAADLVANVAPSDLGFDPMSCDCQREILANESNVDLSALAAGSVVCLRANTAANRGPLKLSGMNGTAEAPILIRNCDGVVHLTSSNTTVGLRLAGSHFRVTGAGAPGAAPGLLVTAANSPIAVAVDRADHFEIDHVEIDASNFAGIMAKVDPSNTDCKGNDRRYDAYVMDGVSLHDNHIHDVAGEGIYLGNSFYTGTNSQYCGTHPPCSLDPCGGMQYPHELRAVRVYRNLVERTGWDGIQVGSAVADCEIADNRVSTFAMLNVSSQNHGIQVGGGSSCRVARNWIEHGPIGLHLNGIGGTVVENNVVLDFHQYGGYVNPRPTPLATDIVNQGYVGGFRIAHNTFVAGTGATVGFRDVYVPTNPLPSNNVFANNLTVFPMTTYTGFSSAYAWVQAGNLRYDTTTAAGFVASVSDDYCLAEGASGVDTAVATYAVTDDQRGMPRPLGNGTDVGALECR